MTPSEQNDIVVYVHAEYNPDEVRTFYEIPDSLAQEVRLRRRLSSWPRDVESDPRTFAQALADALAYAQDRRS